MLSVLRLCKSGVQLVLGLSLGFMVIVKRLLSEETVLSLIQRDCWMSEIMASSESPPSPGSPGCPDTFLGPGVNTSQCSTVEIQLKYNETLLQFVHFQCSALLFCFAMLQCGVNTRTNQLVGKLRYEDMLFVIPSLLLKHNNVFSMSAGTLLLLLSSYLLSSYGK